MPNNAFHCPRVMILDGGEQFISLPYQVGLVMTDPGRGVEDPADEEHMLAIFCRHQLLNGLAPS
jgi:hypothetical protein